MTPVYVVLEGPDGVGKTTLCDAIELALEGTTVRLRCGPPEPLDGESVFEMYLRLIDEACDHISAGHHVIQDRLHVGELVYGHGIRHDPKLSLAEARVIDLRLQAAGAKQVHCTLDEQRLLDRLVVRDGGVPDEKSGARLDHAPLLRRSFMAYCGGALFSGWQTLQMTKYPSALAADVLENVRFATSQRHCERKVFGSVMVENLHVFRDMATAVRFCGSVSSQGMQGFCIGAPDQIDLAEFDRIKTIIAHGNDVFRAWFGTTSRNLLEIPSC